MAPPSCSAALKISARLRSLSPYHLLATASSGTYISGTAAWLAITLRQAEASQAVWGLLVDSFCCMKLFLRHLQADASTGTFIRGTTVWLAITLRQDFASMEGR